MRSPEADEVAKLVQHMHVQSGKWITPYHIAEWQFAHNIPWKFKPALRLAKMLLSPVHDWEPEAFRVDEDNPYKTSLHLSMKSNGHAPLNTPIVGRPTLKMEEIISPPLAQDVVKIPTKLPYRNFLHLELPAIFLLRPVGESGSEYDPNLLPAYDRVTIKPFWFFEGKDDEERAVAEDPFRLVLNISGAPVVYIIASLRKEGADEATIRSIIIEPGPAY